MKNNHLKEKLTSDEYRSVEWAFKKLKFKYEVGYYTSYAGHVVEIKKVIFVREKNPNNLYGCIVLNNPRIMRGLFAGSIFDTVEEANNSIKDSYKIELSNLKIRYNLYVSNEG